MIANADEAIPRAVLIKASEIPVASASAFGVPELASAAKALIIPTTVPNKPTKVATEANVANIVKFFSKIGNSNEVDSSSSF